MFVFVAVLPVLAAPPANVPLPAREEREPRVSGRVEGELLVRFKATASAASRAKVLKKAGATARELIPANARARGNKAMAGTESLKVLRVEGNLDKARAALEGEPEVLYVEPNFRTRLFEVTPNDFEFEALYGLRNTGAGGGKAGADIKASEAWAIGTGSRDVLVAVIDTGMDYFHEDLRANVWTNAREIPGNGIDDDGNGYIDDVHGYDFVSGDSDPFDDHFHGTHVAGTIGGVGDNGLGVVGVCWQARMMAVKAFDNQGNGSVAGAAAAIHYAVVNGARIINASWGLEDRSRALADAVAEAQAAGVLFIAAAGNSHTATPFYPAGYESVVAVASTNNKDELSLFSNFGAHVDLSAPGEQILSTVPDSRYDSVSGTSMAAPHVAGAAALILSRHPEFTAAQVAAILKNTADPIKTKELAGRGRLNVLRAMQIEAPLPNAALRVPAIAHGRIDFTGTASGQRFQRYALAHGSGSSPTNWTEIFGSASVVENGLLMGGFDSSVLDDGTHTFRLTVLNDNGQAAMDFVTAEVQNVQISFPLSSDILRAGAPLQVKGTVFGQGRKYGLSWTRGLRQNVWSSEGFSLPSNAEVLDGVLGTLDTARLEPNEFYSIRLTATNSSGATQSFTAGYIWLDSRLRAGFPIYLPQDGAYSIEDFRQAKVADLDGDGRMEIVIVDHGNSEGKIARLLVYRDDGALKWSRDLNGDEPYADVPTIADLDGDGKLEILVDVGPTLYAFKYDGGNMPGIWPVTLGARGLGKAVADLDGDGRPEIVALANWPTENSPTTVNLSVYDGEGHVLQRWDVDASCGATNNTQRAFPVAANMDDDADLEIVIGYCGAVALYDFQNASGPVWTAPVAATILNSPVVADVDHDGYNDVVVTTWAPLKASAGVYLFDNHGKLQQGWPALSEDRFVAPAAVADLDGDGFLEICVAGERLYQLHVLEHDGFEAKGWPVNIDNMGTSGGIAIADIDGDFSPDVVYATPGYMPLAIDGNLPNYVGGISAWTAGGQPMALNGEASPYASIPLEGSSAPDQFKAAPLTLTDLDGNGLLDMVGASIGDYVYDADFTKIAEKKRASIYAWEFPQTFARQPGQWAEFQHGPENNGYLPTPQPPPQPPEILPIPDQIVGVGQAFPPLALNGFLVFPGRVIDGLVWTASGQSQLAVSVDAQGIARVTPPSPTWEGSESITFSVGDAAGTFARSTVVLFSARLGYVTPAPVADVVVVPEDETVIIDVLANDTNPGGGQLVLLDANRPLHGTASVTEDGKISYRGDTNYFGADTFAYLVQNSLGAKALGTVTVTVTPVNDVPVAVDDRTLTFENSAVTIRVLANDLDADGDLLRIVALTAPANGAAEITATNTIRFTPAAGFNGTNTFTYSVTDDKSPPQTARVTVAVRPLNSAPIAKAQSITMNRNASASITYLADDLEKDQLTFRITRAPEHGELFSYPNVGAYNPRKGYVGADSFVYRASDSELEGPEATVTITIEDRNNPPSPSPLNLMTRINQSVTITLAATDLDDDAVSFRIKTLPQHGGLLGNGSNYVYTPHFNFLGKDEFTYVVSDGMDETEGKVSIETTDKNTAPYANLKFVKTLPNTVAEIALTGADAESNPLTFALTSQPKHGVLTGVPPFVKYQPETNYVGPDRFRFTVNDGEFTSDPSAVTISIAPKNIVPSATNQTVFLVGNGPVAVPLAVTDADGDPMEIVILRGPRAGRLTGTGTFFAYAPSANFGGVDTFTYRAFDGRNLGNEGQVRIERGNVQQPAPAVFTIADFAGDLVQLTVSNRLASGMRIESTSDFLSWSSVTNVRPRIGSVTFTVPTTNALRYFRAISE